MRILVLSDVHANLPALTAVLQSADGQWDECWVLGDTAGYGPDFDACFERLSELRPQVWLAGNHDAGLLGEIPDEWFSPMALWALNYQRRTCRSADLLAFREQLQLSGIQSVDGGVVVHGSPTCPLVGYLITETDKLHALDKLDQEVRFFCYGHTHQQEGFRLNEFHELHPLSPRGGQGRPPFPLLFNPGSVGQPRDNDPRACYALFDLETLHVRLERVPYPMEQICRKMQECNFPNFLHERLLLGR